MHVNICNETKYYNLYSTALRAEITIKLPWNEDYSDKTSDAFKKLVLLLEEQVTIIILIFNRDSMKK